MKAYQLVAWKRPPEFREVPVPRPGPGEVLIRVAGAGACHSDLHLQEFEEGLLPYPLPFTLGHENAGWVEEMGPGAAGLSVGDPVLVYGPWGCGRCRACRAGMENYCERSAEMGAAGGGLGRDGGMAPFQLVPSARLLVPLPAALDPREAAPLADAGLTPYHAVKRALPLLGAGSTAVVIGAGGLGQMAVQLLRALSGARVVAVDQAEDKRALAVALGAHEALAPGEEAVHGILAVTHGLGADAILDMVGAQATLELAARAARRLGQITIVGLGGGALPVGFFGVPWECSVATTYWGTIPELVELVALAAEKRVRTEVELFRLDEAPLAYERMRAGRIRGRAVIAPEP